MQSVTITEVEIKELALELSSMNVHIAKLVKDSKSDKSLAIAVKVLMFSYHYCYFQKATELAEFIKLMHQPLTADEDSIMVQIEAGVPDAKQRLYDLRHAKRFKSQDK